MPEKVGTLKLVADAVYKKPALLVYGSVITLTRGQGGNDADDCSSGYWQSDDGGGGGGDDDDDDE